MLNHKLLRGKIYTKTGDSRTDVVKFPLANRILMNLPEKATEYLDIALKRLKIGGTIHLHQFLRLPREKSYEYLQNHQKILKEKIEAYTIEFNLNMEKWDIKNRILREVSPSKTHLVWDISNLDS
jgi:tRNA (guanine37-N1)-methyltransferase